MASDLDTLNIGSLKMRKDYPIAEVQDIEQRAADPVLHPEAAQAARERIAALSAHNPILDPASIPAQPTEKLVTDKVQLAKQTDNLPTVTNRRIPSAMLPVLTAIGIFTLVLLLFKAPVILSQVNYSFANKSAAPAVVQTSSSIPSESTISIPKINVHAPIVYEKSVQEAAVQRALQDGVVHYGNTVTPGQAGNAAIFGHSSNDWWEPGNFKFVFVLLDKLVVGDRLTIDYQSVRYTYEVTGSKIVEPTDLSVLNQTAEPTVTLITCTPPGTSLRRLVVTAKQIDPAPSKTAPTQTAAATSSDNQLPSGNTGFFDQVSQAWKGVTSGFKSMFGGDTKSSSDSSLPGAK